MFDNLTDSFKNAIGKIRFHDDDKALKKATTELKKSLLKSDVHHKVVKDLISTVELETKKHGVGKDNFLKALQDKLTDILTLEGAAKGFTFASKPPTVVLMIGLQGSGKTTTTGKLALFLKEQKKKKVLIIAADLQRLAAVEQLKQITADIEVELVADESATPTQIVKRGLEKAQKELYDVVLIDTAGRLAIDDELMDELAEVKKVANPDELFYVADAMTGQDAIRTAQTFKEKIGITGVVLSKFDGDGKGGVALGLTQQVGVPLRFIGNGEKVTALNSEFAEVNKAASSEKSEIEKLKGKLFVKREELSRNLEQKVLAFYEKIRIWAGNTAVVPVKKQACYGCYMKLNDKTYAEVIRADEIVNCPHCGRILYLEPITEETV